MTNNNVDSGHSPSKTIVLITISFIIICVVICCCIMSSFLLGQQNATTTTEDSPPFDDYSVDSNLYGLGNNNDLGQNDYPDEYDNSGLDLNLPLDESQPPSNQEQKSQIKTFQYQEVKFISNNEKSYISINTNGKKQTFEIKGGKSGIKNQNNYYLVNLTNGKVIKIIKKK